MKRDLAWLVGLWIGALAALPGCAWPWPQQQYTFAPEAAHYEKVATEVEYPAVDTPSDKEFLYTLAPRSINDLSQVEYWNLSLQEVIHTALTRSRVLLDLGGTVLRVPESIQTTYGVSIQETDPQFGVDAALSEFDANFTSSLYSEMNHRRLNNRFLGDLGIFKQDYDVFQAQISKRAATGTLFAIRKNIDFDDNNNLGNEFRQGAWDVNIEGEVRHPLLQGSGIEFNRIAGPGGRPGFFNGVLVARVRTDISLTEFEMGLRDFLSNVENAYWDLYFAYRDLDTKIKARNTALETWRQIHTWHETGRKGGEAEKEAQAREQYFRFEEDVQNALVGRALEGTRTNNGSTPGTFRGNPGVYIAERRLRLLMGLPPNDRQLIRPADDPVAAPLVFDWPCVTREALTRREELRRQRWQIKGRELELIAAKNFLLPNLDVVGMYRWRGFGEKLIDSDRDGKGDFDNAYMNLTAGEFQEWQLGAELSLPIGFRRAHAGVRNAELRLSQARAVLREQERQVLSDLSTAVAELDRAYVVLQTDFNRAQAAWDQYRAVQIAYDNDKVEFFVVLDAQRRYAEAESRYYQARVEYALALRNVHFEKGSLLDYCEVALSEGRWPTKAYRDAEKRERLRGRPQSIDYVFRKPPVVSLGPAGSGEVCPPLLNQGQPGQPGPGTGPFTEEPARGAEPVPPGEMQGGPAPAPQQQVPPPPEAMPQGEIPRALDAMPQDPQAGGMPGPTAVLREPAGARAPGGGRGPDAGSLPAPPGGEPPATQPPDEARRQSSRYLISFGAASE